MTDTATPADPATACEHPWDPERWPDRLTILTVLDPGAGEHPLALVPRGVALDDRHLPRVSLLSIETSHPRSAAGGALTATLRCLAADVEVIRYSCGRHGRVTVCDVDVLTPPLDDTPVCWSAVDGHGVDRQEDAAYADVTIYFGDLRTSRA